MTTNSNFISLLGANSVDILSSVSAAIELIITNNSNSYTGYYGRYFYLGNFLIQFTDMYGGTTLPTDKFGNNTTINFPIAFPVDTKPYTIIPYSINSGNTPLTILSATNVSFIVGISNNSCAVGFLAIGPRI
jgi:hypothetical protein